jgi:hypothetical protein
MTLPGRSERETLLLDNHDYGPIRASWREARRALKYEYRLLKRLESCADIRTELVVISDRDCEIDCPPLDGLDIGVAGAVLTLAALGCVTVTSCNGGCFGDWHREDYPLIVFYAKPQDKETLLKAARESGAGITHYQAGLMVWANDIWDIHNFAKAIFTLRWRLKKRRRVRPLRFE